MGVSESARREPLRDLRAVTRVEAMTEVVTAIRADVATTAEVSTRGWRSRWPSFADTVENHGLLLARLFDNE